MSQTISIIMPAYGAKGTIRAAVASLLAQTHTDWTLLLVSDDGVDYEAELGRAGLADSRIRPMASPYHRSGASRARNSALDVVSTPYAAILDADDRLQPRKLEMALKGLEAAPIVSTALTAMTPDFTPLRTVGTGPDRLLTAGAHKWINLSMDSMIVWDTRVCDGRYDPALPNMTDLDFLMRLYRTAPASYHLGTPLHDYVKLGTSMSNGEGVTERMVRAKTMLLDALGRGDYPMADPRGAEGIAAFLTVSIEAERSYEAALAERPGLLFEDHLEPLLKAASTAWA